MNAPLQTLCLALESTIYQQLENYRNETEMKYQRLREKQLSEEQEKKMEEEIAKKLKGIDQILNKAKAQVIGGLPDTGEEVKTSLRQTAEAKQDEKTVDLRRVFIDDRLLTSKSQAIMKLREMKKESKTQI
jgi:hypothetical protein